MVIYHFALMSFVCCRCCCCCYCFFPHRQPKKLKFCWRKRRKMNRCIMMRMITSKCTVKKATHLLVWHSFAYIRAFHLAYWCWCWCCSTSIVSVERITCHVFSLASRKPACQSSFQWNSFIIRIRIKQLNKCTCWAHGLSETHTEHYTEKKG